MPKSIKEIKELVTGDSCSEVFKFLADKNYRKRWAYVAPLLMVETIERLEEIIERLDRLADKKKGE